MTHPKAALIYNPSSGKGRGDATAETAGRCLQEQGLEVELHPTSDPLHATQLARTLAPQADVIVVVGGDGTINEVVTGIVEAAEEAASGGQAKPLCRLGIIPTGTVNVVARELKVPFDPKQACSVIAAGKSVALDVGRVNGRHFVLMTGAGIDAVTIRNIHPRTKRWLRSLAFAYTGLAKALAEPQPRFWVKIDGITRLATFFVAGNFRYYAAHVTMTPSADAKDGLLDMLIFQGTTKPSVLAFWGRLLTRSHVRDKSVTYLKATRAELRPAEGSGPVWLQADGEIVGELPATVEIDPAAIEVLVP